MSASNDKGRPAPPRRPASFRSRLMGWVDRVVPWFAVAVLGLLACYLVFPLILAIRAVMREESPSGEQWTMVALYAGAIVGVVMLALAAVRTVSPEDGWPPDAQVRAFVGIGLLAVAVTTPLLVLRAGDIVPALALVVYYVRIRRKLVHILPAWAGGTYRPSGRERRPGEDVIKRPPSSWDETSGVGPSRGSGGQAAGRPRRKQSKKKRKTGR